MIHIKNKIMKLIQNMFLISKIKYTKNYVNKPIKVNKLWNSENLELFEIET